MYSAINGVSVEQNGIRSRLGYTLIEMIVSVGIFCLAIVLNAMLAADLMKKNNNFIKQTGGQTEVLRVANYYESELSNIVRLNPTEDLSTANDQSYPGVMVLWNSVMPSICNYDTYQNVVVYNGLRYTRTLRSYASETVLVDWSEANINSNNVALALQISYRAGTTKENAFVAGQLRVPEVVIYDPTGKQRTRYGITKVEDGVSAFGTPLKRLYLKNALDINGGNVATHGLSIPKGSVVLPAKTSDVCVGTNGSLIEYDELTAITKSLVDSSAFQVSRLRFGFQSFLGLQELNGKSSSRLAGGYDADGDGVDDTYLYAQNVIANGFANYSMASASQKSCVASVTFDLEINDKKLENIASHRADIINEEQNYTSSSFTVSDVANQVIGLSNSSSLPFQSHPVRSHFSTNRFLTSRLFFLDSFINEMKLTCSN